MSAPPTPHILIIGAGVGGLTLAQALLRQGIRFTVFERDPRLDSRLQGYRLKIAPDVAARLRATLSAPAWTAFEGTCARALLGETNLNATDAGVTACRRANLPPEAPVPRAADRGLLRQALMTGVADAVMFGKELVSYEILERGGRVRASFGDGSCAEGDLLVGADGARSVVRRLLLPEYAVRDTGVCCVYGKSPLTEELQSRFPEDHRRWITVVRDQTPVIQSIIEGDSTVTMVCEPCYFENRDVYPHLPMDYVHWGIMFKKGLLGLGDDELDHKLKRDAPGLALAITAEWDPSIGSLIELQDRELTYGMRVLSAPVSIPKWETSSVVTLLGDAVHVMSPSGGVGAVSALHDAMLLSEVIVKEGISPASIARYEEGMRAYASVCIKRSNVAGGRMLNMNLED